MSHCPAVLPWTYPSADAIPNALRAVLIPLKSLQILQWQEAGPAWLKNILWPVGVALSKIEGSEYSFEILYFLEPILFRRDCRLVMRNAGAEFSLLPEQLAPLFLQALISRVRMFFHS